MKRTLSTNADGAFIDDAQINSLLWSQPEDPARVRAVIAKSLNKECLNLEETAVLLRATDPALVQEILEGARTLKRRVYGNRIVLFAPLYIGSLCINDCSYCGFKRSNNEAERITLDTEAVTKQVSPRRRRAQTPDPGLWRTSEV